MPDSAVLHFIASVTASLMGLLAACAWPTAIVFLILLFRKPILDALPNLKRLKAGSFEIEFGEKVKVLELKADEARLPPIDRALEDVIEPDAVRLFVLAEVSPRLAILEAWLLVEASIEYAIDQLGMRPIPVHTRSLYYILQQLPLRHPSSQKLVSIIFELHDLRNKAVHRPEFSLGLEETSDYVRLAIRASNALRHLPGPAD
jgi:hypothetical protein